MAAPKKGRRPTGGSGRPGRALAIILIAMVALTAGMFLTKQTTPRLGIDLAGGTSITLKAKSEPGKPDAINPTNMNTAVGIIERRVNGLGVTEAEVQTQGKDHIIVNIPKGMNEQQAREQVGTTAQLYFRPVLAFTSGEPAAPQRLAQRIAQWIAQCLPERLRRPQGRGRQEGQPLRHPVVQRHFSGPRAQ
ncbi:hypothetical protein GCM10020254_67160 [Streptomyces goshikiensis]